MKISAMKQVKQKIIWSAAAVFLPAAADIAVYACFCTNCRR